MNKPLFVSDAQLTQLAQQYPTPFYLYDSAGIRQTMHILKQAFAWHPSFRNYFAVKATPNPAILTILQAEGSGFDCSSETELRLMEKLQIDGADIMLTSNNTAVSTFQKARDLEAIINLDDVGHLNFLERYVGLPPLICFRYNPGNHKAGNTIIGYPEESKFGMTAAQLLEGYQAAKAKGIRRFGLHTMVASNELSIDYFVETAVLLFKQVVKLSQQLNIEFEFVNLGGGIGIPYRPEDQPVDLDKLGQEIQRAYRDIIVANGIRPFAILMECGRAITGPHGCLVSRVQHIKHSYKTFIGLDASMHNLMRPALYGAYHHLTIVGKQEAPYAITADVTGSLCENNDKFAIDRPLPDVDVGDLVVIHDTGAHGHAMGFNYNGQLRSAELLREADGDIRLIRRAETFEDYMATALEGI